MKGKYLITTDNWFIAPDGKSYRAVWGEVQTMTAVEVLGVNPNRNSANWMVRVGTEEHHVILAGCQIHYVVSCPDRPNQEDTLQKFTDDKEKSIKDNCIYIPEPPGTPKISNPIDSDDWDYDMTDLISILKDLPSDYFNSYLDKIQIIKNVQKGQMLKYKFERPPYKNNRELKILWISGNCDILSI